MITECALNRKENNGTCFDEKHITIITNSLNNSDETKCETHKCKLDIIKKNTKCETDICILNTINIDDLIRKKIEIEALKPFTESYDGKYWLNNTELDSCMAQLRNMFPGFGYSFIHMVDLVMFPPSNKDVLDYNVYSVKDIDFGNEFNKTYKSIARTNDDKISTKDNVCLKSYGVIFNTDTSKGNGQHWYAIYISTELCNISNEDCIVIELFNSNGNDINNKEFNKFWFKTAIDIFNKTKIKCIFKNISNVQHQRDDTGNCGVYSLFYIYSRLNGKKAIEFNKRDNIISDKSMEQFRKFLFRNTYQII